MMLENTLGVSDSYTLLQLKLHANPRGLTVAIIKHMFYCLSVLLHIDMTYHLQLSLAM